MSPSTRGWLPGGAKPHRRSTVPVTPERDDAIFTTWDLIQRDDQEHPLELELARERRDRHDDEAIAQRRIDAMCRENSKPHTSAVLSVAPYKKAA